MIVTLQKKKSFFHTLFLSVPLPLSPQITEAQTAEAQTKLQLVSLVLVASDLSARLTRTRTHIHTHTLARIHTNTHKNTLSSIHPHAHLNALLCVLCCAGWMRSRACVRICRLT